MDIDARTKETAATLLGVASEPAKRVSPPATNLGSVSVPRPAAAATNSPYHMVPPTNRPHLKSQPIPPNGHVYQQHQAPTETNTVLSMSSIGFGIDSSTSASWGDATEAAIKAIHDAMERSTLRLPMTMPAQHSLQIKVRLGVPPKQVGSNETMIVDVSRLTSILPKLIPVLPIDVVVGGLFLPGDTQGSPSICTAVACIILQSQAPLNLGESTARTRPSITPPSASTSPWASLESHSSPNGQDTHTVSGTPPTGVPSGPVIATAQNRVGLEAPPQLPKANRSTSIEMLAMISEEIRLASDKGQAASSHTQPAHETPIASPDAGEDVQMRSGNYNYKKLPPGVTTKNNRRLFVKHSYTDHSIEKPKIEDMDLVTTTVTRTPNAAFPLKLHEILSQIENDGLGDIVGWMPHGRSFKIHKQKEFADIVLPKYFVMTKKSSFLRQLNLYGFNRFSAGPDQGSYYHEKFLRGLKFLCRRMTRQKVNGNRIRSAGNPDEEPVLSSYPTCPPAMISTSDPVISSKIQTDDILDGEVKKDQDGVIINFPLKLHRILDKLEAEKYDRIISWLSHGRAFMIHHKDAFEEKMMPSKFNLKHYSDFELQLDMYNFQKITAGKDKGAYHNANFQRGRPHLCAHVKKRNDGNGNRKTDNLSHDPNLHALMSVPPIATGTDVDEEYYSN